MLVLVLTAGGAPALTVFANPIEEGSFETNIVSQTLRLEPLVLQDFLPLGEKFLIET